GRRGGPAGLPRGAQLADVHRRAGPRPLHSADRRRGGQRPPRRAGTRGALAGGGRRSGGAPGRPGVFLPPPGAGGPRPRGPGGAALREPDAAGRAAPLVRRPRHLRRRRERVRPRRLLGGADQHPRRRKERAMSLLLSAWTVGLLLALLALGVYVS